MVVLVNAPSSGDILYQCIVLKKDDTKKKKKKLTVVVNINSIFCQERAMNVLNYSQCIQKLVFFLFITYVTGLLQSKCKRQI